LVRFNKIGYIEITPEQSFNEKNLYNTTQMGRMMAP